MAKAFISSFLQDSGSGGHRWEPARVECYSGYRGEETPRAVILGGVHFPVAEVLSRERLRDIATGLTVEIFCCRLEAGWTLSLERSENGTWRVRKNVLVPRVDVN